ncbi:hypothetical protein SCLCIDRAFT_426799 [Scleroderma citrinum Foug A]|uniref:Uncharacterized protein n=1 Tax=Scleroderma citrinum Foug A TaxID=1036808 RepID=A0A0C2ZM65_9AGAM|nr:hypothetical protein SCLCIDRAFT_426799 [Scleroderma citrinum Foug A]
MPASQRIIYDLWTSRRIVENDRWSFPLPAVNHHHAMLLDANSVNVKTPFQISCLDQPGIPSLPYRRLLSQFLLRLKLLETVCLILTRYTKCTAGYAHR